MHRATVPRTRPGVIGPPLAMPVAGELAWAGGAGVGRALGARGSETRLRSDPVGARAEAAEIGEYLDSFGSHTPAKREAELQRVGDALAHAEKPTRKAATG